MKKWGFVREDEQTMLVKTAVTKNHRRVVKLNLGG